MRFEDIEQLLKQEGVVYKHWSKPLKDFTWNETRQYAGTDKKNANRVIGIQRQIYTKQNGPVKKRNLENKENVNKSEKVIENSSTASLKTLVPHRYSDVDQSSLAENIKNRLSRLESDFQRMAQKVDAIKTQSSQEKNLDIEVDHKKEALTMNEIEKAAITEELTKSTSCNESTVEQIVEKCGEEIEEPVTQKSNICQYCSNELIPKRGKEVASEIRSLINNFPDENVLMAVVAEPEYYHINVILISTGKCLGCVLATKSGFMHTDTQLVLADLRTFFISGHRTGRVKENLKNIDAYFQYIRQANKKKRLRDEMINKHTYSFLCGK